MHTSTFTSLAILSALAQLTLANWTPGKAAQINFYSDTVCTQYDGEAAAYWNQSPMVGTIGTTGGAALAQCITLNMPGNSKSINTAAIWGFSTTTQPGPWSGHCTFWDGFTCSGNSATSYYPNGGPTCQPARSSAGFLWKSGKCWSN
ncbi:hypothetical protein B0H19DRAFT_1267638 [Mycena capillaripes]|nr:hypothetical protein B0H19DRAFT_1267638 [Mycena capillaripes]